MAKEKVNKWKEGLKKRLKESTSRSTGGSGFFKQGLENVNFWKCDKGDHIIDIVPYTAGPNDPNTPEGEPAYFLEVYAHFNVGAEENAVICMAKTYGKGKQCPICDHRKELVMEGADEETIKALNPKQRCIYNIVSYDSNADEEKGVQVWHVAHWFSEHHFQTLARKPVRGGKTNGDPFVYYMDPEEGKSIAFNKEGVAKSTKFIGHRFIDRDYELPEEFMKSAVVLDDLLHLPTYEEVFEMYWGHSPEGAEGSEDEEVETPKKPTRVRGTAEKKVKKVKKEEPVEEPEEEVEEETPVLDPANCDCDDFLTGFDSFEECEECEYAELCKVGVVKEKPKAKAKAKTKAEEKPAKEIEQEEEVEEEGEEVVSDDKPELDMDACDCDDFGKSPDEFEECESCDYWGPCAEKKAEADSKKEAKPRRKKP